VPDVDNACDEERPRFFFFPGDLAELEAVLLAEVRRDEAVADSYMRFFG
jgi:hypothetical protein